MNRSYLAGAALVLAATLNPAPATAQHGHPTLHVNPRWDQCSFQLDPSLTQEAWRQFTREAGLVVYFRPLADARPMGKGKFEVSMVQWQTGINDEDSAWNDTFVHPYATHWLFEGPRLGVPGLMVRAGMSDRTDLGVYFTKNPEANYGFFGGQVQRNLVGGSTGTWALATRLGFTSLFGPEDLDFTVIGWDLLASRDIPLTRWAVLSPYAGISSYLARSHEKTVAVDLNDEYQGDSQVTVGAALRFSALHLGIEYNKASVNSISMKVGLGR